MEDELFASIERDVDIAFTNSYRILIDREDPEALFLEQGEGLLLAHHLKDGPSAQQLLAMEMYWRDKDEFEKAIKFRDYYV